MDVKIDKLLEIYNNMNDSATDLVKSISELIEMDLTTDDIDKINEMGNDTEKTKELLSLSSSVKYFVEHSERIFKAIL